MADVRIDFVFDSAVQATSTPSHGGVKKEALEGLVAAEAAGCSRSWPKSVTKSSFAPACIVYHRHRFMK
jgi:hypothetical protein